MGLGIYVRTDSAGRMLLRKNRVISYAWDDVTETRLVMDANDSGLAACSGSPVPDAPPGCEHFGGINTVYLDGHVKWLPGCR
jgi:prepilin-type processing-associated H-X9-DG protein